VTDAPHGATDRPAEDRAPSRGAARKQAFLDAALEVFLEQGFEAASVNEVVRLAGGSLATLYQQFGSKEGLFTAVADAATERFVEPMVLAAAAGDNLEEGLQEIGERYLHGMLAPRGLAFFRIIIGEGRKFPTIMQRFLRTGPERVREVVAQFLLERGPPANVPVTPDNADDLASAFCELVRGRHQYRGLADSAYTLTDAQVTAHVRAAIDIFLNGVRPR